MNPKLIVETLRGLVDIQRRQQEQIERLSDAHHALLTALQGGEGTDAAPFQIDAEALARAADAIQELERMLKLDPESGS